MVQRMVVAVVLLVLIGRVIILLDDKKQLTKLVCMKPKVYTESELELNADGEWRFGEDSDIPNGDNLVAIPEIGIKENHSIQLDDILGAWNSRQNIAAKMSYNHRETISRYTMF